MNVHAVSWVVLFLFRTHIMTHGTCTYFKGYTFQKLLQKIFYEHQNTCQFKVRLKGLEVSFH